MITFNFSNDCVLTLRTSGTEPKIKFYSEIKADMPADGYAPIPHNLPFPFVMIPIVHVCAYTCTHVHAHTRAVAPSRVCVLSVCLCLCSNTEVVANKLKKFVRAVVADMLQPEDNGLQAKKGDE